MRESPLRGPRLDLHRSTHKSESPGVIKTASLSRTRPFSPTNHKNIVGCSDPWKLPVTAAPLWDASSTMRNSPQHIRTSPARGQGRQHPPSPEVRPTKNNSFSSTLTRGRMMEGPWDVKESNPWATLSAAKDESAEWFVSSNAGGGLSSSSTTGNPTAKPTAASPSKWGQRVQDVDDFEIANDWRFNGSGDSGERSLYDDTGTPMIRETTAHPILGSKSFPILAVEEGSLNRPISIHDADLLDEREKDVLRQAARKKQPDSIQIMETADARDQDVLQQAAVKRQQERTAHTVLPNSFSLSSNDAVKKEDINNKQKGIMGFFRGNVLGKRIDSRKRSTGFVQDKFTPEASLRSVPKEVVDDDAEVVMLKRPPPVTTWEPVIEKLKSSSRGVSPSASAWAALDNSNHNSMGRKLQVSSKPKSHSFVFDKSASNGTTVDTLFGRGNMMDGSLLGGSNGSNDDGTTVSGVTNPSFFHDENPMKNWQVKPPNESTKMGTDPFDVNSPVFSSGDPFERAEPSPKNHFAPEPVLSNDFSDPFFPSDTVETTKKESGVLEGLDPGLDHVDIEGENDATTPASNFIQRRKMQGHSRSPQLHTSAHPEKSKRAIKPIIDEVLDSLSLPVMSKTSCRVLSKKELALSTSMSPKTSPRTSSTGNKIALTSTSPGRMFLKTVSLPKSSVSRRSESAASNKTASFMLPTASSAVKATNNGKDNASMSAGMARKIRERSVKKGVQGDRNETPQNLRKNFVRDVAKTPGQMQPQSAAPGVPGKGGVHSRDARSQAPQKSFRALAAKTEPPSSPVPPPEIKRIGHVKQATKSSCSKTKVPQLYAPAKTDLSVDEKQDENSVSSEDTSLPIRRQNTGEFSFSSVGSDIQRLRSILRRSRLHDNPDNARRIEPLQSTFAVYDEKLIQDPMQRAGLRLLSAAVIPIQAAARRHLAFRLALTRMWAIVVIQSSARRWFEQSYYSRQRESAVKIQALYRGVSIRDHVLLEHCCAIEIQRHVRGLIASLYVFEEMYKVTLTQACVRRKLAMNHAMERMVAVIQIQALFRGRLLRMRFNRLVKAATFVQTAWRAFSGRFNYQLDLLDVIIVQSVWRRQSAQRVFKRLVQAHRERCVVKIQSQWRSYDCTMNYLHYLSDVLITQSAVRRWRARKRCLAIRNFKALVLQTAFRSFLARFYLKKIRAAILLQSTWRGFVCYADYMFTISDIVLTQSIARCWLQKKQYPKMLEEHNSNAAITIQKHWRSFSQATDYFVMLYEKKAASSIQSCWRRFVQFSKFIIAIDSVIRIQSACRSRIARQDIVHKHFSSTVIQCVWRILMAKKQAEVFCHVRKLFIHGQHIADDQVAYATDIQRVVRGTQVRDAMTLYTKSRSIQAAWRGHAARKKTTEYRRVRTVQALWRGYVVRATLLLYLKARSIQATWRGHKIRFLYIEYISARRIQSFWRGSRARGAFHAYLAARCIQTWWRCKSQRVIYMKCIEMISARRIQTFWRCKSVSAAYRNFLAARRIQAVWRGTLICRAYREFVSARRIQAVWRGKTICARYKHFLAARHIQAVWRGKSRCTQYRYYVAARHIQTVWRRVLLFTQYKHYLAARIIQAAWRGRSLFTQYKQYVASRHTQAVCIQAAWRGKSRCTQYKHYIAARHIQSVWRGKSLCTQYNHYIAARHIQAVWRGKSLCTQYKHYVAARHIQSVWRGKSLSAQYKHFVAARYIQAVWRGRSLFTQYKHFVAARHIQAVWRGRSLSTQYKHYIAARNIQAVWRGKSLCKAYTHFVAARYIQAVWRGKSLYKAYTHFVAARHIQAVWRGKSLCKAYTHFVAARRIQSVWKGKFICRAYGEFLSARRVQTLWRCKTVSIAHKRYRETRRVRYDKYNAACRIQAVWRRKARKSAKIQYLAARTIQSNWRRVYYQDAFKEYIAARCIQTFYRSTALSNAYARYKGARYIAARRIQTFCRCRTLLTAFERYKQARRVRYATVDSVNRIQTSWRRNWTEHSQFVAARRIQAKWRCKTLRTGYTQYLAARRLQAFWRCMTFHVAFKKYTVANRSSRRIQTFWRSKSPRKALQNRSAQTQQYRSTLTSTNFDLVVRLFPDRRSDKYCETKWYETTHLPTLIGKNASESVIKQEEKHSAATVKDKTDKYCEEKWSKMNPAPILIGNISSGTIITLHEKSPAATVKTIAATMLEKIWRGFIARQEYWHVLGSIIEIQTIVRGWIAQRRLRFLRESAVFQIGSATKIKTFLLDNMARRRCQVQQMEVDRAARTIQRFFSMVKSEVDREIRAERRRRKSRKKQKKMMDALDDKILENVWRKAIEEGLGSDEIRKTREAAANALGRKPCHPSCHSKINGSEDRIFKQSIGFGMDSIRAAAGQILCALQFTGGLHGFDDEKRIAPKSRLSTLSKCDIDDDLILEEAWIDSKILHAKERRRAEKRTLKRSGQRRLSSPKKQTFVSYDHRPPRRAQEV